ncbi:MAG: hypothetical protein M1828_005748 [Chrysothrix sp. TS-e1954]|nr:MAG: hypothetical protein M1828_005748 [Chrysothrix sp. TS-e1954]
MENFIECAVSNLATSSENFIYRIIPNGGSASEELQRDFVSISSDDSLTFFKVRDRSIIVDDRIEGVNKGVTCLEPLDEIRNIFATAGRDGVINLCNGVERALKRAFRTPNHEAISAIAPSQKAVCLVAGTESQSNGPGQVSIYVWDLESSAKAPLHKFEEWHTDSITTLSFLPQNMHVLLSGSTDGLVTMFDLRETGEEAEPVEIFNTGSAVNLASPVCEQDSTTGQPRVFGIFVASHNEDLSFQATTQESRQRHEGMNIKPWNFRADLGTDYAISLRHSARRENHILLAVGANKV